MNYTFLRNFTSNRECSKPIKSAVNVVYYSAPGPNLFLINSIEKVLVQPCQTMFSFMYSSIHSFVEQLSGKPAVHQSRGWALGMQKLKHKTSPQRT